MFAEVDDACPAWMGSRDLDRFTLSSDADGCIEGGADGICARGDEFVLIIFASCWCKGYEVVVVADEMSGGEVIIENEEFRAVAFAAEVACPEC